MKKMNSKGFTLIELLAVIVIMGILMMVAIPAMTRYIENSRKDTFVDTAKQYANAVKNMWASDSLKCTLKSGGTAVASAVPAGIYYVKVDSTDNANNLLESGGNSSWGNAPIKGFVKVQVYDADDTVDGKVIKNAQTVYSVQIADSAKHGIKSFIESDTLARGDIKTSDISQLTSMPSDGTECVEQ